MLHPKRKRITNFATILVLLSLMISTTPPELGAKYDQRFTTTNETITLDFDETFTYQSSHSVFGGPEEILTLSTIPSTGYWDLWDWGVCETIQLFASSWDCTDLDDSSDICNQHWSDGCYLEYDEFTIDLQYVYEYEIRHQGSVTLDVSTTWYSSSSPSTTVSVVSSSEDYTVAAKAYMEVELKRTFLGANSNYGTIRNTIPVFTLPFVSPYDIDGGGNTMTVGSTTLYIWDDYVTFYDDTNSNYGGPWNNAFGSPIDLDGSITLAQIDLLELVCDYLYDIGNPAAPICMAMNYIIEANFVIQLDFNVDITTWIQTFLSTESINSISNTYSHYGTRLGYGNWMSSPNTNFAITVPGTGSDINGILGLHHQISTDESYSTSIYIQPTSNPFVGSIWNAVFGTISYIQIPLSTNFFPSTSSGSENILTDSDFTVIAPSGSGSGSTSNSAPIASLSFDSTSSPTLQIQAGDQVRLTTQGSSDPDGDNLDWTITWGDGSQSSTGTTPPIFTPTHTYNSPGTYYIYAGATDGQIYTYPSVLTVVVSPVNYNYNLDILVTPDTLSYAGDTLNLEFTGTSNAVGIYYCLWDGNSTNYETCLSSLNGNLQYDFDTFYQEGTYAPTIDAYDGNWNYLGRYTGPQITVVPDTRNNDADYADFEIIGDEILIVIDDSGNQLTADREPMEYENSNNSAFALSNTLETVSTILDVDFDVLLVGDSDWDNEVDDYNADGPGLDFLKDYSTVIWSTGNSWYPLTDQDQEVLRAYVGAGGNLVMFSQDLLWGECSGCEYWEVGDFARDVFGVRYSEQDSGEPAGDLSGESGAANWNLQYLPFAGLNTIEISSLDGFSFQDVISEETPSLAMNESFEIYSGSISDYNLVSQLEFADFEYAVGDWYVTSKNYSTASNGWYSIRSGSGQGHSTTRSVEAYTTADSNYTTISFDLHVDSELGYDYLKFYINDIEQGSWSGLVPWQQVTYSINQGVNTLRWSYEKDGSVSIGQDQAWVDNVSFCCTESEGDSYSLNILNDEAGNNYGIVKMHTESNEEALGGNNGRAALFTIDPVQISHKFDLETMFIQLIDWSENEFNIGSQSQAAAAPVGLDATHPARSTLGGTSWFKTRLFAGQNIEISSSMAYWHGSDYRIHSLSIHDTEGNSQNGIDDASNIGKTMQFQAPSSGVYYIAVEVSLHGTEYSTRPWLSLNIRQLIDDITYSNPSELTIDSDPLIDHLSPNNWATQSSSVAYYADYSNSAFITENLTQGVSYGFEIKSLSTSRSQNMTLYFYQGEEYYGWAYGYLSPEENYIREIIFNSSSPLEIWVNNIEEYGNPHLNTFTYSIELWVVNQCQPGYYLDEMNLRECIAAPPGSYVDDVWAREATKCISGTYQPYSGQSSCFAASPGKYVEIEGAISENSCHAGTYNPFSGASECIVTPSGTYSGEGSISPSNCPAGTYNPSTGSTSSSACITVQPGYYSTSGSPSAKACPPGTFQSFSGKASCQTANPGYFVNQAAQTTETPCSEGFYQPIAGQTNCLPTSPGFYTDNIGATEQIPAPLDTFAPGQSNTFAIDCPAHHITLATGSESSSDCLLDTDEDRDPDITDTDDDNDGFTDSKDSFPLDKSENTDTDNDGLGNNADDDDDGDTVVDNEDAFPLDSTEWADNDGDGQGDNSDSDDDNDGVIDGLDTFPLDPTEWEDRNNDGLGDNANPLSITDHMKLNPAITVLIAFIVLAAIGVILMLSMKKRKTN